MLDVADGRRTSRVPLVALAVGVAAALGAAWLLLAPAGDDLPGMTRVPAPDVSDVRLLDHAGPAGPREVDLLPPPNGLTFVYFGYLSCPDVCPTTMADIARARREVGEAAGERTRVAFVTVDPERDGPDRLRGYLEAFFGPGQLALSAPSHEALAAAADRFGVRWEIEAHAPGEDYDVAHTAVTYVIDDRGTVVRELPFGVPWTDFAAVMRALL